MSHLFSPDRWRATTSNGFSRDRRCRSQRPWSAVGWWRKCQRSLHRKAPFHRHRRPVPPTVETSVTSSSSATANRPYVMVILFIYIVFAIREGAAWVSTLITIKYKRSPKQNVFKYHYYYKQFCFNSVCHPTMRTPWASTLITHKFYIDIVASVVIWERTGRVSSQRITKKPQRNRKTGNEWRPTRTAVCLPPGHVQHNLACRSLTHRYRKKKTYPIIQSSSCVRNLRISIASYSICCPFSTPPLSTHIHVCLRSNVNAYRVMTLGSFFPLICSCWEWLWMVGVEAHAEHCRMTTMLLTLPNLSDNNTWWL